MSIVSNLIILVTLMVVVSPASAKVEYVSVDIEGIGLTVDSATYDGIIKAVSQVNGVTVSSKRQLKESEQSSTVDGVENNKTFSSFKEEIDSATKGVVKEFRVLEKYKDENDHWVVVVQVVISKYKLSKQVNRLRVSVLPLRIGSDINDSRQAEKFTRLFNQALVSYLTQSRKFAVLDRDYTKEQDIELNKLMSGETPADELAKLNNKLSADYMVVGQLESISLKTNTVIMKSTGRKFYNTGRRANVSYRVIDMATGQVKFSDAATLSDTVDGITEEVVGISKRIAINVGENILNAIYPVYVESYSNGVIYLGQGGSTLKVGDRYKLTRLGKKNIDSHTNESLGREELKVGVVEIVDVQSKQSVAKVISITIDLEKSFNKKEFIVRPVQHAKSVVSRAQLVKKAVNKNYKEFNKKVSDDW